ncbi:unnamed protein product [Ixodes hexagonus]
MDKGKKPRKGHHHTRSTIGKPPQGSSAKKAKSMSIVPVEDSGTTKGSASIEETRVAIGAGPARVGKPVGGTESEEASLHLKERTDDLLAFSNLSDPEFTDTAFPAFLQERLSTEGKFPPRASFPFGTAEEETKLEKSEIGKVTGFQEEPAWQTRARSLPGIDLTAIFGNGFLQYTTLLIVIIAEFALICHNLLPNIVASSVDHWCKQPLEFSHMTITQWRNISAPRDAKGDWDQCRRYEPLLTVASSSRSQVPCQEWDYDPGGGRSIITEWDLVCDRRWLLNLTHPVYMGGVIASMPIAGMFSDEIGRRPVICVSVIVLVVLGMAVCFAESFLDFLILRFFVAASVSTVRMTSLVLLFELSPPKYQLLYCVLAVGGGLVAAPPLIGVLGILKTNWILAQALIMMPTSLLICVFYFIAESPHWIVSRAKYRDVEQAMLWAARMNGACEYETKRQWRAIFEALRQVEVGVPAQGRSGLIGIMGSPNLLRRCVVLFFVWFVAFAVYYARFQMHRTVTFWLLVASVALKVPSFYLMYGPLTTLGRRPTLCVVFVWLSVIFGFAVLFTELKVFPVLALFAISLIGVIASLMVFSLPETISCAVVDTIDDMNEANRQDRLARLDYHLNSSQANTGQSKKLESPQ